MDFIAEPTTLLFLVVRSAILLAAFLALAVSFRSWRRASGQAAARLEQAVADATQHLQQLAAAQAQQQAEVLARLAGLQQHLEARLQVGVATASSAAPRGYELALRRARAGAPAEEVAEASGVTLQEAQLLVRLHGPRRSA